MGNTAASYQHWERIDAPYQKNKVWYIKVKNPLTKLPKEVRWYPNAVGNTRRIVAKPLWKQFGFTGEDDSIQIIREKDLTKTEVESLFLYNWERGGHWLYSGIFGGCWRAPRGELVPAISHAKKVFLCSWKEYKMESRRYCDSLGLKGEMWND